MGILSVLPYKLHQVQLSVQKYSLPRRYAYQAPIPARILNGWASQDDRSQVSQGLLFFSRLASAHPCTTGMDDFSMEDNWCWWSLIIHSCNFWTPRVIWGISEEYPMVICFVESYVMMDCTWKHLTRIHAKNPSDCFIQQSEGFFFICKQG